VKIEYESANPESEDSVENQSEEDDSKAGPKAPKNWLEVWKGIDGMRKLYPAAVDSMGCD